MARHRLTLSISPELKHALDELNAATGVAAASFVGEIIEGNIPMILALAEAARKAKAEPAKALELMQRYLIEASQEVDQTQLELAEQQSKLRTFVKKDAAQ
jgi:predicted DNA-binding protein